jgi:hypothetical protein
MEMRYTLSVVWILAFLGLFSIFQTTFPLKTFNNQLDLLEKSILNKDWEEANLYMTEFKDTFEKKRYFIQINNSTEMFGTFDLTLGQLDSTVRHNQDSALEYIGALKETLKLVVKPFSGP